jgi:hypothetical protein
MLWVGIDKERPARAEPVDFLQLKSRRVELE